MDPTSAGFFKEEILSARFLAQRYLGTFIYELVNTTAIDLRLFHHCKDEWLTPNELARRCGIQASEFFHELLRFLSWTELLEARNDCFRLARDADALTSPEYRDHFLHRREELKWLSHLTEFLRTGRSREFHASADSTALTAYHNAMAGEGSAAAEMVSGLNPSTPPAALLDIGGGSGHMSEPFLNRFPGLKVTIIDLPFAVEHFRDGRISREYRGRVSFVAGDARSHELGVNCYDFVVVSHLLHHLQPEDNGVLIERAVDSLKPGGILVVGSDFSSRQVTNAHSFFTRFLFAMSSGIRAFYLEDFHRVLAQKGMPQPEVVPPFWHLSKKPAI